MVTYELLEDGHREKTAIRRLLELADEEFVPPLSARTGTKQREGLDDPSGEDLSAYLEAALDHQYLLARQEDRVVGLLSFHEYDAPEFGAFRPANYVSTVIVHPDARRNGYARGLYEYLIDDLPRASRRPHVTTRTWGTNDSHIALLEELGFVTLEVVPDDRGPGIDTVYFGLDLTARES